MKQVLGSAAFHSKEPVPVLQCEMKQEPVPVFPNEGVYTSWSVTPKALELWASIVD